MFQIVQLIELISRRATGARLAPAQKYLQWILSEIRLETDGGTPFDAMQRYEPISLRDNLVSLSTSPLKDVTACVRRVAVIVEGTHTSDTESMYACVCAADTDETRMGKSVVVLVGDIIPDSRSQTTTGWLWGGERGSPICFVPWASFSTMSAPSSRRHVTFGCG